MNRSSVTKWLPQHLGMKDEGLEMSNELSDKDVVDQALDAFDKRVKYNTMLEALRERVFKDEM